MRSKLFKVTITVLCILVTAAFLFVLCSYAAPSDNSIYDLTINGSRDNELNIDNRGWTVFLQENKKKTVIIPEKDTGFYEGVSYLGQTFYYSRTFHEKLDHATLSIGAVDSNIVVFLDNEVIYTDCPETDCRIGHLTLPSRESDRQEGVTVALPNDYLDKTVTIAQSTSVYGSDNQNRPFAIFPAEITLYSAFAKESRLIAATLKSTVPVILLFTLSLFFIVAGLSTLYRNETRPELFILAVVCFLENIWLLFTNDISSICMISSPVLNHIAVFLPYGIFLMLCVLTIFLCIKETIKSSISIQIMLLSALIIFLLQIFYEGLTGNLSIQIHTMISSSYISFEYFIIMMTNALLCGTILGCCQSFLSYTIKEYAGRQILLERTRQMQDTYENLKVHTDQTNRLIHDNRHHLIVLQDLLKKKDSGVQTYIDELLSGYDTIRPTAASGNELLDILLNATIERSAQAGITIEFEKCQAPAQLILSDVQACSLYMNVLENAINAAKECEKEKKIILSLYIKDEFFIFKCINTSDADHIHRMNKRREVSYGLKIITDLVTRYNGLVRIHPTDIPSENHTGQASDAGGTFPDTSSVHAAFMEVMIALPLI